MAITGTSTHELDLAGIFYGRRTPLHPIRPHTSPTEGSLWVVAPFTYTPTIGQDANGNPIFTHHPPWDINDLITAGPLGQTTKWPPGQGIVLGNGQQAHWDGTKWQPGPSPFPLTTGVTMGAPGTFTGVPATHRAPTTKAELDTINGGSTWNFLSGQYVVVGGTDYYWNGITWVAGRSQQPLATTATAGAPGYFGPANHRFPANKTELDTINGGAAWTTAGNYVVVGGTDYYWSGTAWVSGRVPSGPALATGVTEGLPGVWFPINSIAPTSKAQLDTINAGPAWSTPGSWVSIGPLATDEYYWNGTTWVQGRVPGLASGNVDLTPANGGVVGSIGSLTPSGTTVPNSIYVGVFRTQQPPSFTIKWGTYQSAGASHVVLRFVTSSGVEKWRSSSSSASVVAGTADMTAALPAGYLLPVGDFVFVEFHYSNGTVSTIRAQVGA